MLVYIIQFSILTKIYSGTSVVPKLIRDPTRIQTLEFLVINTTK